MSNRAREKQLIRDWLASHGVVLGSPRFLPVLPTERVWELVRLARAEKVAKCITHSLLGMTEQMQKHREWRKHQGKQRTKFAVTTDRILRGRRFVASPSPGEIAAWRGDKGVSAIYETPVDNLHPFQGGLAK